VTALQNPWVLALAVFMAGLVLLSAVGGIVFLAWSGKSTEAIGVFLLAVLGLVLGRLKQIKDQTNGHQTAAIDTVTTIAKSVVDNGLSAANPYAPTVPAPQSTSDSTL